MHLMTIHQLKNAQISKITKFGGFLGSLLGKLAGS